ncbi:energy transducer TonB [Occallatibacter savannae]|uniref:energy transducer TonB n=1 Tax=Occallatibacter savannae TaxID=1002691 RepID=UPI000D696272|nr:energy transducer TonB [Occallatibacter savannae]
MGEFGSKSRKANSKIRPFSNAFYNTSSLAVDLREDEAEKPRTLYLVPSTPVAERVKPTSIPTFGGLDSALKERDPKSRIISAIVHVVVIGGILYLGMRMTPVIKPAMNMSHVDFKLFAPAPPPAKILPVPKVAHGGGGGGIPQPKPIEVQRGTPPVVVSKVQLNAPQLKIDNPKMAIQPTVNVTLPDQPKMANLGESDSPQIKLASQGSGQGGSFGHGLGGGFGAGKGNGVGAGQGGGYGGGLMSVGGGVSAPSVLHSVQPEFTEEARQAQFQGTCSIQLIVDAQGNPQNVHVTKHLGMGLDEKAIEAVRQYKFKPAMYDGHPVAVQIVVEVEFHLH